MDVFTTKQAAVIAKLSPQTIRKCFDSGDLGGFRVPGSRARRIPREDLIKLLKEHGIPLGKLENTYDAKVLIVSRDEVLAQNIKNVFGELEEIFKIAVAHNAFHAGMETGELHPDCIVVDFSIGRLEALQMLESIRRNPDLMHIVDVGLIPEDGPAITKGTVHETFRKPFDSMLLAMRIQTLVEERKNPRSRQPT